MSEQTPDEQLEQLEQPADEPQVASTTGDSTKPSSSSSDGKRFAAYDTRYERFVGKPQDTKAKAKAEAKAFGVEGKALDVREV